MQPDLADVIAADFLPGGLFHRDDPEEQKRVIAEAFRVYGSICVKSFDEKMRPRIITAVQRFAE